MAEKEYVRIHVGPEMYCLVDKDDLPLVMKYSWRWSPHSKNSKYGYVVATGRRPNGRKGTFSLHRLLMDPPKDKHVDHINGDRLDNRRCNLRLASRSQNNFNVGKISRVCSSSYKGVCWNKDRDLWQAGISQNGKYKHLGLFRDEAEAALVYDVAAYRHMGEFARLNFPLSVVLLSTLFKESEEKLIQAG